MLLPKCHKTKRGLPGQRTLSTSKGHMNMLLSIAFPSQYWRKLLQNTKPQHVTKQMRPPPTHTHTSDEQKLGMDLQNVFLDLQSKLPLDKVAGRQAAVFPPIKCHLKLLPCKT